MASFDRLFESLEFKARVFHAGGFCNLANFDTEPGVTHLHMLRSGSLEVRLPHSEAIKLVEPTLLFLPRATSHQIFAAASDRADLICASIHVGKGHDDPLLMGLPRLLVLPLRDVPQTSAILGVLFEEAFAERVARSAVLDRLSEVVLMHVFRFAIDRKLVSAGTMAAFAHPRLSKVVAAIHDDPSFPWTLELLAERAHMSRARFAPHFLEVVGMTPGDYLTHWRMGVAQLLLSRGKAVTLVAADVGYASPDSFGRAFTQWAGMTPRQWAASARKGDVVEKPTPETDAA